MDGTWELCGGSRSPRLGRCRRVHFWGTGVEEVCSRAGTGRVPGQQDTEGTMGQVKWQVQVLEQQSWGKERAAEGEGSSMVEV